MNVVVFRKYPPVVGGQRCLPKAVISWSLGREFNKLGGRGGVSFSRKVALFMVVRELTAFGVFAVHVEELGLLAVGRRKPRTPEVDNSDLRTSTSSWFLRFPRPPLITAAQCHFCCRHALLQCHRFGCMRCRLHRATAELCLERRVWFKAVLF